MSSRQVRRSRRSDCVADCEDNLAEYALPDEAFVRLRRALEFIDLRDRELKFRFIDGAAEALELAYAGDGVVTAAESLRWKVCVWREYLRSSESFSRSAKWA
jgi:hypothetical protein